MTKQTKDGWIRHRGGDHAVRPDAMIEYRCRSGNIYKSNAGSLRWGHEGDFGDIMSYRVCEPVVDRAQVDTAALAEIASINVAHYSENPLQWRDRITQIDADIKFEEERHCSNMACMDQERADLVSKLAAEGFALIAPVVAPGEDMGDWRNWKAGDLLECIDGGSGVETGQIYQYTGRNEGDEDPVVIWVESNKKGCFATRFKFHSRPTN